MNVRISHERARRLIAGRFSRHRPGPDADIAIVSSPRSGSTWMMEAIAGQRGYKFINEPDHCDLLAVHGCLAIEPRWNWLCLTPSEADELSGFLLDDARSGLFGPVRPRDVLRSLRTTRRVLKLVRMNALIEWLYSIGFQPLYLIRHPIPVSISCIKRNHSVRLSDFLAAPCFADRLTSAQVRQIEQVQRGSDKLAAFVTQWCLENLVPLRSQLVGRRIAVSSYEARVLDPDKETKRVATALSLPAPARLARYADRPSRVTDSSTAEAVTAINAGHSGELVSMWRRGVDEDRERSLFRIVELYEIAMYKFGQDMPEIT